MKVLVALFILFPLLASATSLFAGPDESVSVVVDGRSIGSVRALPRAARDEFVFEAGPFLESLATSVRQSVIDSLAGKIQKEVLSLKDLDEAGLATTFDEGKKELRLEIPLEEREGRKIELKNEAPNVFFSDRPSGFLNARSNHSVASGDAVTDSHLPTTARIDFVQSVRGWTLESFADYFERRDPTWRRGDVRLVHDDVGSLTRWTIGDFQTPARDFERTQFLGGFSVRREFSIDPDRTAYRLNETEIFLKRDSTVDVVVNGSVFTQLRLPAGRFNLRDYPLLSGLNRVTLKVRDDLGTVEAFDFDFVFEGLTLEKDQHEFSYSVGFPWTQNGSDRLYETNGVFTSISHRTGWSDSLTLGANLQNYYYRTVVGGEIDKATRWGLFAVNGAACDVLGVQGFAIRGRWRSLDSIAGLDPSWRLSVDLLAQNDTFFPVATTLTGSDFGQSANVQISKAFPGRLVASVGETYEVAFRKDEARRTDQASLTVPIGSRFRVDASYQHVRWISDDDRGLVTLTWTDEPGRYSASAFHDSGGNSNGVSLSRANDREDGDWRANVRARTGDDDSMTAIDVDGLFRPAEVRLSQFSTKVSGSRSDTTTLGLDTGVVWVGSEFAISAPITDAFVLKKKNDRVEVLRSVTPYATTEVDDVIVKTGYRQGVLVKPEAKVLARGTIVRGLNRLSLVTGAVVDSEGKVVSEDFFTNRDGRFVIENLTPGIYSIQIPNLKPISISVPADAAEAVDLGLMGGEEK